MPLTLVTGPANSAKAGVVLDAFRARRRQEPWLVLPTRGDVRVFERELLGEEATQPGRIATFAGLTREIARRAGWWQRSIAPLQQERLVAQAVSDAPLDALAGVAGTPGFLHSAQVLIAELQRSLIAPQRFTAAVRAWPQAPRAAHEAAAIYDRYARALERLDRVDAELVAWRALDALRARPAAWGATPVFLYGFDDLTPLERDAVETLARVADAEVAVSLTYEAGRAAFGRAATLVGELVQLAQDVRELPPDDAFFAPASRAALHHLERNLFEPGADRRPPGDAVRLLVAGGARAEAELVAAEVLQLIHEEAVPAEEIAVVLRSPDGAAALLEQVFAAYGIAYARERKVRFAHTALGRGLLALARCALHADTARPADLLAYLRTPGRLERPELADRLELTVRRRAVTDVTAARRVWEEAPGGWPLRELDRLRGAAADGPQALLSALAREARTLFAAPYKGRAVQLDADEEIDARALAALVSALDELAELVRADPRRAPTADHLLEAVERLELRIEAPARAGAVLIADPLAIRARRFDTVVVCGLQEGAFPKPAVPEPFLSDEERRALNAAAGLRLAAREDRLADERYLFYAAVSRADRRVILSCRDADEEGNPALPSFFVDDVRALFDELPARHRPLSDVTWPLEQAPTAAEHARAEALAAPRETPAPLASLGSDAQAALRQREVLSAGGIEAYARCPVKWLVERELAPERFEPDPEAIARGSCVHRVLERVLGQLEWPLAPEALPAAEAVVREAVAEEAARLVLGRGSAAQAAAAHEIAADVTRLLRHEAQSGGGFTPAQLELAFGFADDGGLGPLVLRDPDPTRPELRLRGVIDRVDLDRAGRALVRDYKSGRKQDGWPVARWRSDDQLQVALYMIAVRELLRREPVGGVYQPLRGGDLRARGVVAEDADTGTAVHERDRRAREELEAELDAAAARACELAARLRGGELCATPETCSPNGCAYPGICRAADQ